MKKLINTLAFVLFRKYTFFFNTNELEAGKIIFFTGSDSANRYKPGSYATNPYIKQAFHRFEYIATAAFYSM